MSGNFEVCPVGTLQRLAQVEADLRSMRLCFEVTELERSKYKAERDALKAENERLNGMLSAANWHRAQEEHNALRAERDALRDAFRKGFYAGFAATGEGWNGEYPFQDTNRPIAGDPDVEATLDAAIAIAKAEGGGND